jgi:LysM repeat protein
VKLSSLALVAAALLLAAGTARAQSAETYTHRVKKGDSLELLAAEYYGDRRHAIFIMVENDIEHSRKLKKREKIRIPISRHITTNVGDTLAGLAAEHLGDERRAPYLATFNNLAADASLAVGQEIEIPFHVTHTAAGQERVRNIAAAYFQDKKKAALLAAYNFLDKDKLAEGESIVIPIFHVRVRASKLPPPDPDSAARLAKRSDMQSRAERALKRANADWATGAYGAVKRMLTKIDTDYLDTRYATDVGVLLGCAYIAFDDIDSAIATFEGVLERNPKHKLGSYRYSPKIRKVWTRAGGIVDSKTRE